ncbi:MAG: hypothetical protein Q4Q06_00945, partial [Bacteroidota bacterium]|nr:hypothetical protein [Bacteroidota bacterium]
MRIKTILPLLCCLFVVLDVVGQQKDSIFVQSGDTAMQKVFYFSYSKTDYVIKDLFHLDKDFSDIHYYDPTLETNNSFFQYLSVLGTPSLDLIYKTDDILNYQRQANNYKPYIFTNYSYNFSSVFSSQRNNVKYFQTQKAYSAFTYSAGTDAQQYFNVIFAKNLYKGLNLQTEYNVNYADGNLANSQVMNQFFNISLNYISPKGLYKNSVSFVHSRAYILENGGILSDSMFLKSEYSSMETYPTALTNGWSKWKTNEFYFNQSLRISKDTVHNYGALVHNISYEKYARLYTDENKTQLDSLPTTLQRNSLYWTNVTKKDILLPLHIGINYDRISFSDSLNKENFDILTPEVRFGFKEYGEISFLRSFSNNIYNKDYDVTLFVQYPYTSLLNTYLKAKIQDKQEDYIFSHYLTENLAWENKVNKVQTKSLTFGISLKKHFALEISYFHLSNKYWFDSLYHLYSGSTNLYQINFKNNFSFHNFVFKGLLSLQKTTNNEAIRLPVFAIKQTIYYSFYMMKGKLPAHFGVDINYNTNYYADLYRTTTGMFVRQNDIQIGNHVYADLFLSIRVQRFSIFASLTHLTSFLK